jgi:hypothetical protein
MQNTIGLRGDQNKTYDNLKIYDESKAFSLGALISIKKDPLFDTIRNEPEFQQVVRDIETKYLAEHDRVGK